MESCKIKKRIASIRILLVHFPRTERCAIAKQVQLLNDLRIFEIILHAQNLYEYSEQFMRRRYMHMHVHG